MLASPARNQRLKSFGCGLPLCGSPRLLNFKNSGCDGARPATADSEARNKIGHGTPRPLTFAETTTSYMPKGYAPSVFVSSTCYDLNQVRADLRRFLENMSFDAVLSESPAFPVSPQISPVENCLLAVKNRADIFVLIVGSRYGSQNKSGKSVTNLEYNEAKAKGIPVYVFVSKQILNALPIWKKNPNADYTDFVNTPKLFEFVETLRSSEDHWVFEFDEVIHIIETLRRQLSYLLMDGLALREQVRDLKLPAALLDLSGKSLRLLMERPTGWEYWLFGTVLAEEMEKDQELKWDVKYGLKIGSAHAVSELFPLMQWIQQEFDDILGLVHSAERLMNQAIQEALREPGVPGDPEHIVYVSRRIARVRKELLAWTIGFQCASVKPECERLISLIAELSSDIVAQLESIPSRIDSEINKAIEAKERGEAYMATVMLKLSIPNIDVISAEFQKLIQMLPRLL